MAYADTVYTFRLGPELLERGRANLIQCPAYISGALSAPSVGTVTVYDPSATAVVDAQAVTITASVAEYSIASATLATYAYATGWTFEWALTMADGVVHTARTDGSLVRRSFYPVVTDADLIGRLSALDPSGTAPITSAANYQAFLDEAWRVLVRRLVGDSSAVSKIVSGYALREAHLLLTLSLIMTDLATRSEGAGYYADEATRYRAEYGHAYAEARVKVDAADDGSVTDERVAVRPVVWMGSGARWLS